MKHNVYSAVGLVSLIGVFMVSGLILTGKTTREPAQTHKEQIEKWRADRHARLQSEDGWLTLVGLEWLADGENHLGGNSPGSIQIPGDAEAWGTIDIAGDEIRFVPVPGRGVMVDGTETGEVSLVDDSQGEPTIVSRGDVSFYVLKRGAFALRIKDRKARVLQEFDGMENFDFQPDWRIDGRFIPAEAGQTIDIVNVLGQLEPTPVFGYAEFVRDGKTFRLLGLGGEDSEAPWFLFTDRTSGRETYGAGRYLYADGLPVDGRLVIDFNKAYNPPCVFSDYATCPLPPQENRLDLAVTAGEKTFNSH